jgi:hypothetical protein
MTSTAQSNQIDKFPIWATLVIAFVVVSFASVYVAGILTIKATQRIAKELVDPSNIAVVANAMGGMPEKLPEGFSYRVGLSVNDEAFKKWFGLPSSSAKIAALAKTSLNFLAIEHSPDGQQVVIVSSPQEEPKDSKEILEAAYELGINTGTTTAHFKSIKDRGQAEVAGMPMPYLLGDTEDTNQKLMQGMIGCISIKDKHRSLLVYGIQPEGETYNLAETLDLLHCIQGFQ